MFGSSRDSQVTGVRAVTHGRLCDRSLQNGGMRSKGRTDALHTFASHCQGGAVPSPSLSLLLLLLLDTPV